MKFQNLINTLNSDQIYILTDFLFYSLFILKKNILHTFLL